MPEEVLTCDVPPFPAVNVRVPEFVIPPAPDCMLYPSEISESPVAIVSVSVRRLPERVTVSGDVPIWRLPRFWGVDPSSSSVRSPSSMSREPFEDLVKVESESMMVFPAMFSWFVDWAKVPCERVKEPLMSVLAFGVKEPPSLSIIRL